MIIFAAAILFEVVDHQKITEVPENSSQVLTLIFGGVIAIIGSFVGYKSGREFIMPEGEQYREDRPGEEGWDDPKGVEAEEEEKDDTDWGNPSEEPAVEEQTHAEGHVAENMEEGMTGDGTQES